VDIFFVISGYLISGILYKGHKAGNFSFKEFYARRIRRLFPALITVLVITMAYGWLVLLADEYEQMGKHVAGGTIFAQNFMFWKESGYFDKAAELKSLLHLWSLAVEEQFYIAFPLLLVVLWKKPKVLLPTMVVLLMASFIGNVVMSLQSPETDFYLTPYRGWEFLGGSLLAWWHYDRGHEEEKPKYREALSWTGVLLLGLGMGLLEKHQPYPGWRALLPVAGALLLMEGGKEAWVNRKILSHPLIVWIGLISYPLYLFHWPALSFVHIVKGEQVPAAIIWAALVVALLLTIITYYGIEKRIRHNSSPKTVPILVTAFLITGAIATLVWTGILKPKSSGHGFEENVQASRENNYFDGYKSTPAPFNYTRYEYGNPRHRTLFIGDSHMEQCAPRIRKLIDEGLSGDRGALFLTRDATIPIYNISYKEYGKTGFSKKLFDSILDETVDQVVIDANWCFYFNWIGSSCFSHGFPMNSISGIEFALYDMGSFFTNLKQRKKKAYLILTTPVCNDLDPKIMINRSFSGGMQNQHKTLYLDDFLDIKGFMPFSQRKLMARIKSTGISNGAVVIDPMIVLAPKKTLLKLNGKKPINHDPSHLTSSFVREHAVYLDKCLAP